MSLIRRGALLLLIAAAALPARAADVSKLLPDDATMVVSFNMRQFLDSELIKKNKDTVEQVKGMIEQALPADNPAMKYLKAMGIDPFKDLHSVTMAMGASTKPEAGFILIEGNFNAEKFNNTAAEAAKDNADAVKITKKGNNQIVEITPPGDNARVFTTLAGKNMLLVAGSLTGLTDGLERVNGTKKNNLKKEFRSLVETTSSKQSMNIVATGAAIAKLLDENPNIPEQQRAQVDMAVKFLKNIDGFSVAITLAKDIQFQLGVNAKDNDTAKTMAQQAQKGLAGIQFLLQLQAGQNEKLAPLMDILKTLKVTNQGSNLIIQGQVTPEVIGELMKNLPNN